MIDPPTSIRAIDLTSMTPDIIVPIVARLIAEIDVDDDTMERITAAICEASEQCTRWALAELAASATERLDGSLRQLSVAVTYAVQIAVFAVIFWFLEATNQMSDLVQSTTAS